MYEREISEPRTKRDMVDETRRTHRANGSVKGRVMTNDCRPVEDIVHRIEDTLN